MSTAVLSLPANREEPALSEVLAIDVPRCAQVLKLSPKTIRRRIADGTIPHIRIAGRIRVPVEGLRRMLNGELVK